MSYFPVQNELFFLNMMMSLLCSLVVRTYVQTARSLLLNGSVLIHILLSGSFLSSDVFRLYFDRSIPRGKYLVQVFDIISFYIMDTFYQILSYFQHLPNLPTLTVHTSNNEKQSSKWTFDSFL